MEKEKSVTEIWQMFKRCSPPEKLILSAAFLGVVGLYVGLGVGTGVLIVFLSSP